MASTNKTALMASCAIPMYFPPQQYEGKQLVDGGVTHNLPDFSNTEAIIEESYRHAKSILARQHSANQMGILS